MEKLPDQVKNILIVSDEGTDKLAAMADKILEMNPRIELASVVQEADPYDMLLKKISSLEQQIATLTVQHTRDRQRSRSHQRNRSRSRSRKHFDPDGKYCFFHFKFGKKCYPDKCKPPCSWKQPENCN
ncbi:hypothetical protein X975_14502, partial [Stegodyphus mimosarum]